MHYVVGVWVLCCSKYFSWVHLISCYSMIDIYGQEKFHTKGWPTQRWPKKWLKKVIECQNLLIAFKAPTFNVLVSWFRKLLSTMLITNATVKVLAIQSRGKRCNFQQIFQELGSILKEINGTPQLQDSNLRNKSYENIYGTDPKGKSRADSNNNVYHS